MFVNRKRKAFTLIEILIVMVIIGFMLTMIPSWLFRKKVDSSLPAVMREFNNLLLVTRQQSITSQKTCRLLFKSEKNVNDFVVAQIMDKDLDKPGKDIARIISSEYLESKYSLPKGIKMEAVYLGKEELFSENRNEAYCYVSPNSLVQNIFIHVIRKIDDLEQKVTFKVEPFLGEFELHSGFLKP